MKGLKNHENYVVLAVQCWHFCWVLAGSEHSVPVQHPDCFYSVINWDTFSRAYIMIYQTLTPILEICKRYSATTFFKNIYCTHFWQVFLAPKSWVSIKKTRSFQVVLIRYLNFDVLWNSNMIFSRTWLVDSCISTKVTEMKGIYLS